MRVALVGNQNSGKSTLFNELTGLNQKIGNWPGVTIEQKSGIIRGTKNEIIDLPGIYSLNPYTIEEEISVNYIKKSRVDLIVNILDATCLERSLYLTTQLLDFGIPVLVLLNMADKLESRGLSIDLRRLEARLGTKVLKISALKCEGIDETIKFISTFSTVRGKSYFSNTYLDFSSEEAITKRYEKISKICLECIALSKRKKNVTQKLDKIFLNKFLAIPIFVLIMFLVYFLSVGVVGSFATDYITDLIESIGMAAKQLFDTVGVSSWITSLICDGIINGVGAVISFLPQLVVLFLCIAFLESTGYMSRISFLLDKIFKKVGLSGKALIPFIVGTGCSVPGIMSAKILESEHDRKVTSILTPFIPCSAKLPIIALFTGYFFEENYGVVATSFYLLAILITIISSLIIKLLTKSKRYSPYILELPEYNLPNFKYIFIDVWNKIIDFIKKAGTLIFLSSILVWFLLSFSWEFQYGVEIEKSILAYLGKKISWFFKPIIGVTSWEASVSALQGLIAKEQVISSMKIISGLSSETKSAYEIFGAGSPFEFFNKASSYAFVAFNLFSAPCFAAISAMRRELGSFSKTLFAIAFQIFIAWSVGALCFNFIS